MDPLRWQYIAGCRSLCGGWRWRCGRNAGRRVPALVGDPPNAATLIVGYVKCTIGPDCQSGRAMRRSTRLQVRPGKTVSENYKRPGSFAVGQWLKDHIIAPLRFRSTVPGSMECDESAVLVRRRELIALVDQHVVGRPMRRKCCYRSF